jgi:hypothetical protein
VIDVLAMDVSKWSLAGKFFQLFDRTDADNFFTVIGNPDGDWVAPVAVA